ncbi:hypothetical protein ACFW2K_10310 [Streptomyces nigra]|uniref:hypothetical protein n=1 Tax=Streptomyces nigra TaxID=1827580 RepID=UPI0036960CF6
MEAADWISIYAAVVATAAFVWQALTYWDAKRPKITLSAAHVIIAQTQAAENAYWAAREGRDFSSDDLAWIIYVWIVNAGRSRVHLRKLQIAQQGESSSRSWSGDEAVDFPLWLEPGESLQLSFTHEELIGSSAVIPFDISCVTSVGNTWSARVDLCGDGGQMLLSPERYDELANAVRESGGIVPTPNFHEMNPVGRNHARNGRRSVRDVEV